jgi:hypothetical protein
MNNQQNEYSTKEKPSPFKTNEIFQETQKNIQILAKKERNYVNQFKMHHKITFAFLVFFALNLLWYGMWQIISTLPILKNPIIAVIVGTIILFITGYFYENLISTEFNKKSRKTTLELHKNSKSSS